MQTIKEFWESYKRNVVSKTASETQLSETETAFFAGALSAFEVITKVGSECESEEDGVEILKKLEKELDEYIMRLTSELLSK